MHGKQIYTKYASLIYVCLLHFIYFNYFYVPEILRQDLKMQQGSRIPRFAGQGGPTQSMQQSGMSPQNYSRPPQKMSRLELMQQDYQKGIMREKEEKIISLYETNQQKALDRVNQKGKGNLRDFFQERRTMGAADHNSPTMQYMYQKKKSGSIISGNGSAGSMSRTPNMKSQYMHPKANAGIDRSNLLAPIERNGAQSDNPFASKKPKVVRPKTFTGQAVQHNKENHNYQLKSAPTGEDMNHTMNGHYDDPTPSPNAQHLQSVQQKRKMLQQQRTGNRPVQQSPSTNTRQNPGIKQRQPPSRNKIEYEPSDEEDDEGFDDNGSDEEVKRKQQELLAQIEKQQQELNKLRNERMVAEKEVCLLYNYY